MIVFFSSLSESIVQVIFHIVAAFCPLGQHGDRAWFTLASQNSQACESDLRLLVATPEMKHALLHRHFFVDIYFVG